MGGSHGTRGGVGGGGGGSIRMRSYKCKEMYVGGSTNMYVNMSPVSVHIWKQRVGSCARGGCGSWGSGWGHRVYICVSTFTHKQIAKNK